MNYLKSGLSSSDDTHERMEMSKPLTPRSERPRKTWGSLLLSLGSSRGLCPKGKCFKKEGHAGDCYPA